MSPHALSQSEHDNSAGGIQFHVIRRFVVVAMLGLATSVAVAWGCAVGLLAPLVTPRLSACESFRSANGYCWWYWSDRRPGVATVSRFGGYAGYTATDQPVDEYLRARLLGVPAWSAVHCPPDGSEIEFFGMGIEDARGWPLLSMRSEMSGARLPLEAHGAVRWGIELPWSRVSDPMAVSVLPFRPIWIGAAIDTAFYGISWFAVLYAPGMVRRWRRSRLGLCPDCGYDLRAAVQGRCPECGAVIDRLQQHSVTVCSTVTP